MTTPSIEQGIQHIDNICDHLNTVITQTGKQLDKNDATLWGEYLHKWKNDDWRSVFLAFDHVCDRAGIFLDEDQQRAIDNARFNLKMYSKHTERAMDIRRGTTMARKLKTYTQGNTWHALMVIRDVYSEVIGDGIRNEDQQPKTPGNTLFVSEYQQK